MAAPALEQPIPPWMVDLPKDSRGYLVPAETPWLDGAPRLADIDPHRTVGLAFRRACAVCGYELKPGRTVYRTMSQHDAAFARGQVSFDADPGVPGHLSCMLYSVFVCPYWRSATGRLRIDSLVKPGARRGGRPAVLGFTDFTILISAADPTFLGPNSTQVMFGYHDLIEDLPFREPDDLADHLSMAIESDSEVIDLRSPRTYWLDSDRSKLHRVLDRGVAVIRATKPRDYIVLNNVPRDGYTLPLG